MLYLDAKTSLAATLIVPIANIENTISIGPNQYTTNAPMIQPTSGQTIIFVNGKLALLLKRLKTIMPKAKPIAVVIGAANQRTVPNTPPSGDNKTNTDNQIE